MSAQACTSRSSAFGRLYAEAPRAAPGAHSGTPASGLAVAETIQPLRGGWFGRIWRAYRERRRESQLRNLAADMDVHMLQDVGAPAWLVNESTVQRELARLRNADYMRW